MPKIPGGFYIKARKIQESKIQRQPPHVREIWDWFLRMANHGDRKVSGKVLQRGQLLTSYKDISDGLSWKVGYRVERYKKHEIQTATKWLMKHTMILTTRTTRGMIVTILNYNKYQNPKNYETYNETTMKHTMNLHDKQEGKELKNNIMLKFNKKVTLPDGFYLTDEMKKYASKKNYVGNLDDFTENFILSCQTNPNKYKYQNWYAAWQKWLQNDMKYHPENKGEEMFPV